MRSLFGPCLLLPICLGAWQMADGNEPPAGPPRKAFMSPTHWGKALQIDAMADPPKTLFIPLPTDPKTAPEELQALRRAALGKDAVKREWAVGTLLQQLPVGMPRENVEQWLGKGEKETPEGVIGGREDRIFLHYFCRFPNGPGRLLMSVHYETRWKLYSLVEVTGPHFPDN